MDSKGKSAQNKTIFSVHFRPTVIKREVGRFSKQIQRPDIKTSKVKSFRFMKTKAGRLHRKIAG